MSPRKSDLRPFGILPGKCVDDRVIAEAFGIEVPATKDPTQRKACGCVVSRDIGMYESCLFGCQYCYATKSFDQARLNFESHDPELAVAAGLARGGGVRQSTSTLRRNRPMHGLARVFVKRSAAGLQRVVDCIRVEILNSPRHAKIGHVNLC